MSRKPLAPRFAAPLVASVGSSAGTLVGLAGGLWISESVDLVLFGGRLDQYGIVPRTFGGLWGILFAPFLHGGFGHLATNTIALVMMWPFLWMMLRRRRDLLLVGLNAGLTSGLAAWVLGPANTVTVGFSGVLFGFLGYLVTRGFFERSMLTLAVSGVVIWLFGGMLFGVVPGFGGVGVSWQAHLGGFVGGVLVAARRR